MKSWKTTLAGILAGAMVMIGSAMQQRSQDPTAPPITAGNVLPGIAIMVLGGLAKDYDKTNAPNPAPTQIVEPPK